EEKRNNPDIPLNEKVFENHNLTNMDNKEPNRTVADYTEAKEKAVILDEDTKKTIKDIDRITGSIFSQAMFIDDFSQNKLDAIMNTGMLIQAEAGNGKLSNSIEKAFNERFENNNVFNDKDKVLLSEFVKNTTAENNKETSSSNLKDAYFNANYKDTQKNKNAEEILIDNIIKSGIFSNEENELLNIAVSVEENRLKGNTNNSASYSEDFMNKVIQSENISEKSKEKLLNMSIKTENQEIFEKEGGTRLYFDKDKFDKFSKLKLSKEVVEALDIKLEDERFSLKIPEDDKLKKQLLNSIKVSSALEKLNQMKRGEKVDTSKPVPKNVSVGLKALLNTQSER
ncbi:MAG: hypothetical protein IKW39_05710, partial [Alphaproteobacteria bacterium]|nr:hypothetical protein [Alphaproteobacteria bacterium]